MHITKENIHEFIDGTRMNCRNKGITHIDFIPDHIKYLHCNNNKLTKLPKLPNGLISLYCGGNKLISLPKLPESLKYLKCYNNNLPYPITIDNYKEHNKLIKRKNILEKIRLYH